MNSLAKLNLFLSSFRSILSPFKCEICLELITNSSGLCSSCQDKLLLLPPSRCEVCALPFESDILSLHRCAECLQNPPSFSKVEAVFEFEEHLATLLHHIKFSRQLSALSIVVRLAQIPFQKIVWSFSPDYLVPVPLSWRRNFARGFNQSYVLTQALKKNLDIPYKIFDSIKRRHTTAQAQRSRAERLKGLRKVFSIHPRANLEKKKVLIIDDVLTTGATAEALSQRLLKRGAQEVRVFVLARVGKHH